MAIVTFCGDGNKETGNTASVIATAAYMSIKHNMKILLISTNFNEDTVKECFWVEKKTKTVLPNGKTANVSAIQSGIEGLSRMISSSKIEPRIIKDYTRVILKDRFDVLLGYNGVRTQYKEIQRIYPQVIAVSSKYYDMVIVDLDRKLDKDVKEEIIKISDIKVITTNQRIKDIQSVVEKLQNNEVTNKKDVLMVMGKYDNNLKFNAKNVTRSILRQRKIINTVPYNGKFFEAMQEGTIIDLFLDLLRLKNKKDPNYFFLQEIDRLTESINEKWEEVRMKRGI